MQKLTDTAPDWRRILRFLPPIFERVESSTLASEVIQQYVAQLPPLHERSKVPLVMLHLYRVRLPRQRRTIFYFEASKEYPRPPDAHDPSCNNISLLGGWVSLNTNGKLTLLNSQFSATDCDMKEGGLAWPFAILTLSGKTFAVVEEDSYEGEAYVILRIGKHKIRRVLETYAGSC